MKQIILLICLSVAVAYSSIAQVISARLSADSLFSLALEQERSGQIQKATENYQKAGEMYFDLISLDDISDTLLFKNFFQCQRLYFQKQQEKVKNLPAYDKIGQFLKDINDIKYNKKGLIDIFIQFISAEINSLNYKRALFYGGKIYNYINQKNGVDSLNFCTISFCIGESLFFIAKYDSAIRIAEVAYSLCSKNPILDYNPSKFCNILLNSYSKKGNYDIAKEWGDLSLKYILSDNPLDTNALIVAYSNIGANYARKRDFYNTKNYFNKAEEVINSQKVKNNLLLGYILGTLGVINQNTGNYSLSLHYLFSALQIQKKRGNVLAMSNLLNNIAITYMYMGEREKSLNYINQAIKLGKEKIGRSSPETVNSLQDLCYIYLNFKQYPKALKAYHDAYPLTLEVFGKNSVSETNLIEYMGQIKMGLKDYDSAIFYFDKQLDIFRSYKEPVYALSSAALNYKAGCYTRLKDFSKALYNYQEAIHSDMAIKPDSADPFKMPPLQQVLDKNLMADILFNKGNCLYLMGKENNDSARYTSLLLSSIDHFRAADSLIDDIRNYTLNEKDKIELGEKKYQVVKGLVRSAVDLYKRTGNSGFIALAYRFASTPKMAALRDALERKRDLSTSDVPDDIQKKEHDLNVDIAFLNGKLAGLSSKAEGISIRKELLQKTKEYENLVSEMEKNYPRYYSLVLAREVITADQLQKVMPDTTTAIIDYFPADSILYSFVIRKNRISVRTTRINAWFTGKIGEFVKSIKTIRHNEYTELGYLMYNKLIRPLHKDLSGARRLIIIPSGELCYIPFEALLTAKTTATEKSPDYSRLPYLIRKYDICYHYSSLLLYKQFTSESHKKTRRILAMAPSFAGSSTVSPVENLPFDELPSSESEVKDITAVLRAGGWQTKSVIGRGATESLFDSLARGYNVFHLSTHSFINEKEPLMGGIAFSHYGKKKSGHGNDGILYSWEIYSKNFKADLAVLSSCQSGSGKLYKGEGMISLTRSFLYAGCNNVIFSLWKVWDPQTAMMMDNFYKGVVRDKSYSRSLREAKLQMIANPGTSFPCHWSAFIQVGTN